MECIHWPLEETPNGALTIQSSHHFKQLSFILLLLRIPDIQDYILTHLPILWSPIYIHQFVLNRLTHYGLHFSVSHRIVSTIMIRCHDHIDLPP